MVEAPRAPLLSRWAEAYGLREARGYGRTPWLLTLGTLILGTGRGIVAPFLVLFLVVEQDLPLAAIGVGIAVEFVVRALIGPVAGAFSDRHGRKPVMLLGLFSTTFLLPAYLLVETPVQFLALSVANGLLAAHSLYGPAAAALVVDLVPPERRAGVFGLIHASRNLGWTLGIALGAVLVGFGFWPVFVVGGILPLAFFLVALLLIHEPARHEQAARPGMFASWGLLLRTRPFVAYLLLSIPFYLAWGGVNTIFSLFLTEGLGLGRQAVAILALNSALIFLLQIPFGRYANRKERAVLLAVSLLALEAAYAFYALADPLSFLLPALATVALGLLAFTVAEMLFGPILSSFAAELAPVGHTGSAIGLLAFASAVGQAAPPFLVDLLVPRFGWGALWALLAGLCVPAALGLLALGRHVKKAPAAAPGPEASDATVA